MAQIWMYSGPPFDGGLFRACRERLGEGELRYVLDARTPEHGVDERAAAIAAELAVAEEPVILVGHGLAVPAVIGAAIRVRPAALILADGPITRLDPVTRGLAALAAAPAGRLLLTRILLHPGIWLRYLASSAGLRRVVINPYVMDRDNVAALAGSTVATQEDRLAIANYIRSLGRGLPEVAAVTAPTWLIWGGDDPLYPPYEADYARAALPDARWIEVAGGQFAHPDERPWELAEHLSAARDVVVPPVDHDSDVALGQLKPWA